MNKYELILRRSNNHQLRVVLEPPLAWGIMYAFVQLDMYCKKYVGMQAQCLRPAANGKLRWHKDTIEAHDIRVCLDLPGVTPDGETVELVVMKPKRLFAGVISKDRMRVWGTMDASDVKLRRVGELAAWFGPMDKYTLERYCKCSPISSAPQPRRPFTMAKSYDDWVNPLPRLEITPEFEPYVQEYNLASVWGEAHLLSDARTARALIRDTARRGYESIADVPTQA